MAQKSVVAVTFVIPTDGTDNKSIKKAYAELAKMIKKYGEIVEKDPNVLILDSRVILSSEEFSGIMDNVADTQVAELTANTPVTAIAKKALKVEQAIDDKPVKDKPIKPAKVEEEEIEEEEIEDVEEKPQVRAMSTEEYNSLLKSKDTQQVVTKPAAVKTDIDALLEKIFEKLKRTDKSVTMLTALIKGGDEVTIEGLIKATKLEKSDISSWFAQTGNKIKAVERVRRGVYRLNPDKV